MDSLSTAESAIDDVEISIFDAEKYFNEELNDIKRQDAQPSQDPVPSSVSEFGRIKSPRSATPSEASWNSQTALLAAAAHHRASKRWSAAKKWFFRRNCCCINGRSIRVKEEVITDHTRPIVLMDTVKASNRISHAHADRSHKIHQIRATEAPRQQRISATGRPFIHGTVGFTFPILNSGKDDDVGSDGSSDLFEIEAFSTQTTSVPLHCRCDSVDGDSNCEKKSTPTNGVGNVHRSRLNVCDRELEKSMAQLRQQREEVGGGEGRRKSDGGAMPVSFRPPAVEGSHAIPLPVGGRPLTAEKTRRGSCRSPPLVSAAALLEYGRNG